MILDLPSFAVGFLACGVVFFTYDYLNERFLPSKGLELQESQKETGVVK